MKVRSKSVQRPQSVASSSFSTALSSFLRKSTSSSRRPSQANTSGSHLINTSQSHMILDTTKLHERMNEEEISVNLKVLEK